MDPNLISTNATACTSTNDVDDWDTEGFVVPSILAGNSDADARTDRPITISAASSNLTNPEANKIDEKIHLVYDGPSSSHNTKEQQPPCSTGLENSTTTNSGTGRKQKLKHKLREADKKFAAKNSGRENRIENLREIMGAGTQTNSSNGMMKGLSRDWLDPHCHESEFDRPSS